MMLFNSVWIGANAGSGKTTALTRRVVALMLMGVEPERILCITYTRAAASEMRGRVLSYLREKVLLAPEAECRATIESLTQSRPDEAQLTMARGLFGRVLDSPTGGPQLMTIHGFAQSLLTRFPLEAGVSPHFTVLDDAATENLQRRARHRLLSGEGDADLRAAMALIGERMGEKRFGEWMADIAKRRADWDETWNAATPEMLRARINAAHGVDSTLPRDEVAWSQFMDASEALLLRQAIPLFQGREAHRGEYLEQWLRTADPHERFAQIKNFSLVFLTKESGLRASVLPKKLCPEGTPLWECVNEVAARVFAFRQHIVALAAAEESYAMAVLAKAFLDQYRRIKTESQALDYDDLIVGARKLLSHPTMLGWVMEKLDHRIDHLLIDEAQDTSADQWTLAESLVDELIANAGGTGSGGLPRSLLVVGDEKQSIYSFNGAAPKLFAAKENEFRERLSFSDAPLLSHTLNTSYRSAQAVLSVVDAVIAQPRIASALSATGQHTPHKLARSAAAGRVVLHPIVAKPEAPKIAALSLPMEYPELERGVDLFADAIAQQARALIDAGRAPGDILILLHQRTRLMLPLIRALERHRIPVGGTDRLVLTDHLAVRDLLALMQWCLNPRDDLALAQVLRSPLIGVSEEELLALAHGRPATLWERVENTDLARWLAQRAATPYDFLTTVLETDGARTRFAQRFGAEVQEVFDELKAQAAHLPQTIAPTLATFHDWLSRSARQIKRDAEEAGDTVRVMTVHGAKGLEAPVVLIADLAKLPNTGREMTFFTTGVRGETLPMLALSEQAKEFPILAAAKQKKKDEMTEEYQRLLYVALTRAADELHLFGLGNAKGIMSDESWYETVREAMASLGAEKQGDCLVLTNPGVPETKRRKIKAPHTPLPDWARLSPAALARDAAVLTPSRLGESAASAYAASGDADARERGVRLHRVLEWLGTVPIDHLTELIAHASPDWDAAQRADAEREVRALHTEHGWLWSGTRHAEVTIAGTLTMAGAAIPATGQIDLLVERADDIVVVDYKTGRHAPETPAQVPDNYLLQLKTYRALVAGVFPDKPIRVAILWTAQARLMWLDEAVDLLRWPYENVMLNGTHAA